MQLQSKLAELKTAGITPVAVSYDSIKILARFAKDRQIGYPLLSDSESRVIAAYNILLNPNQKRSRMAGIPHPGTFIIGQDGKIIAKLAHDGYRQRHTADEIIEAAKGR